MVHMPCLSFELKMNMERNEHGVLISLIMSAHVFFYFYLKLWRYNMTYLWSKTFDHENSAGLQLLRIVLCQNHYPSGIAQGMCSH